ncbi:hypothetical protein [Geodermatophilus pulveris]|uniref:hypothetical protein n=1 Tax=Geodermatophilus pulveris TaxID=1564159 RepID=UPI000B77603F|nr:hypothetical protein [Geodermatophilus pulveris]
MVHADPADTLAQQGHVIVGQLRSARQRHRHRALHRLDPLARRIEQAAVVLGRCHRDILDTTVAGWQRRQLIKVTLTIDEGADGASPPLLGDEASTSAAFSNCWISGWESRLSGCSSFPARSLTNSSSAVSGATVVASALAQATPCRTCRVYVPASRHSSLGRP